MTARLPEVHVDALIRVSGHRRPVGFAMNRHSGSPIVPISRLFRRRRGALWRMGFGLREVGTIREPGLLAADAPPEVVARAQAGPVGVPTRRTARFPCVGGHLRFQGH